MKNYYAILDVPLRATQENITVQYHILAKIWHPDRLQNPVLKNKAEEKIKYINEAYEVLGNAAKRAQYDRELFNRAFPTGRQSAERQNRGQTDAFRRQYQAEAQRREAPEAQMRPGPADLTWEANAADGLQNQKPTEKSPVWGEAFRGSELILPLSAEVKMTLMHVPAGEFLFGDLNLRMHLDEYWIGKYPVTVGQYRAFLRDSHYPSGAYLPEDKEHHPVPHVSWDDAIAFCAWAAQSTDQSVSLPTDAEWEKAARGMRGSTYPWGELAPNTQLCNYMQMYQGTTPVGMFSPRGDSLFGCTDLAGNVWEWLSDQRNEFGSPQAALAAPTDALNLTDRYVRGGSWRDGAGELSMSDHSRADHSSRVDHVGFRCCVRLKGQK